MYALVDVNAFYASCETVFRPDLRGKPVVVLSNNDGCVIARSAEAKALGINMAAPYFKLRALFEQHGVVCFSSNYELYADMSRRVMDTLEQLVPRVEIYSIDEAFCDLTGVRDGPSLEALGREIRETIFRHVHLTVGVGIAPTKTLAKLANHAAKKWQRQTDGVVDLSNIERQKKLMAIMPVSEVWGIGRRLTVKLEGMGINNVLKLANTDIRLIRKSFNVVLERTVRELRGEPCLEIEEFAPVRQDIISSRSFSERVSDYDSIHQAICLHASGAARRLRKEHQFCRRITAFIKTSPHASAPYYSNGATVSLLTPTQDTRDIIGAAVSALDKIWREGNRYMKAGVMLGDFHSKGVAQLNLFDERPPSRYSAELMNTIDAVNAKSGRETVFFAGQGIQRQWEMKREMLSPRYTTRFSDLLRVK